MSIRLFCGKLVNPAVVREHVVTEISGRRVVSVTARAGRRPAGTDIDLSHSTVIPGLIDMHIHGALGDDFAAGITDRAPKYLASQGTTCFLATLFPPVDEQARRNTIGRLSNRCREQGQDGAKMLGIHLEGPFLNPDHGSQTAESCRPIAQDNVEAVLCEVEDTLRMISLSPEVPGAAAAVRTFEKHGVVTAAAHTEADGEQMQAVYDAGLRHVTHILNATETPEGNVKGTRCVGCVEFTLASKDMTADVMVDAGRRHVADEWLKIVFNCLGAKRLALLSDAMLLTGLPAGLYPTQDGRHLRLADGQDVATIDGVGLTGSAIMMLDALKNLMARLDLKLEDAIECATLTPARVLRIDDHKGRIESGKDADLVAIDDQMRVLLTVVEGKVVYRQADKLMRSIR